MKNPWICGHFHNAGINHDVETCDAESRLDVVRKETDPQRLRDFIAWEFTQKTVRQAAERRLRKIVKSGGRHS